MRVCQISAAVPNRRRDSCRLEREIWQRGSYLPIILRGLRGKDVQSKKVPIYQSLSLIEGFFKLRSYAKRTLRASCGLEREGERFGTPAHHTTIAGSSGEIWHRSVFLYLLVEGLLRKYKWCNTTLATYIYIYLLEIYLVFIHVNIAPTYTHVGYCERASLIYVLNIYVRICIRQLHSQLTFFTLCELI